MSERVAIFILVEMILLLFNCYTTMAVVFLKREQWQQLMKNLKIIIKAFSDNRAISRAALAAIFALIFTLALEIFSYSVWSEAFGWTGTTGLIVMCDLILMEVEKIRDLYRDLRRDY
ncbi:hypothetical protein BDFB_011900, partial [Asbolus verrucosus]